MGRRGAILAALLGLALPAAASAELRWEDPEGRGGLTIAAWVQPRAEVLTREDDEDLSSFFLRRVRVDLQGWVFTEKLTFRVMPELRRSAVLQDAWIEYAFSPQARLRFGQHTVPFQWHRFISPRRQHFAERGLASETFGFPSGRDIGLMFHGRNEDHTVSYAVGVYDGAGINVGRSDSAGNMVSGRVAWALLGEVPRDETDFRRSPRPGLALGLGLQGATRSEIRAWDLGRSPVGDRRADWATGTADVSFRGWGYSVAADVYHRRVSPRDGAVASYEGRGFMVTAGATLVPDKVDLVARYGELKLDRDDPSTREEEWGVGVNLYHRGHDWKTRIQVLEHRLSPLAGGGKERAYFVEGHLQF